MTTDAVGGVWTYALDLAAGLAPLGFDTTLVVLGPSPTPDQMAGAAAIARLDLVDTRLPLDWTARAPAEVDDAAATVRSLARRTGADVIHLNSPALAAADSDRPVVGVCHSCLVTWWSASRDGPMPDDFGWRSRLLWRGMLRCDALIAPTAAFAEATARAYDIRPPFVVHNGRSAVGAPATQRKPVVFASGRLWDDGKNARALDAAAAMTTVPVYAAGPLAGPNGSVAGDLRNLRTLGLLAPADVRRWLDRASIYASSALYEPFGLGVLEAAQAGCALVLSDIPTFRELWDGAAIFVDPRRPADFAEAFDALADDPLESEHRGRLARARAEAFSTEAMARGVAAIYGQVLAGRRVAPRREAAA
jgi:glycosyltransferase involved in cell wall biosynthesis